MTNEEEFLWSLSQGIYRGDAEIYSGFMKMERFKREQIRARPSDWRASLLARMEVEPIRHMPMSVAKFQQILQINGVAGVCSFLRSWERDDLAAKFPEIFDAAQVDIVLQRG